MKIDIADAPKIRNLLDQLLIDQHNLAAAEACASETFRVTEETGSHMGELTKAELLTVFKGRIENGLKTLNSKFYIEFKNSELPIPAFKPTSVDGVDVTAIAEEGAQA